MAKKLKMKARDILNMSRDEVWSLPDGKMTLVFDDGELETTNRRTIYCSYIWDIHRAYPKTPLLKQHHMGMKRLSSKVHLDLLGHAYESCFRTYQFESGFDREEVWRLIYVIVNTIYNDFIQNADEYVSTLNVLGFLEALEDEQIKEANDSVQPTQKSIDTTYDAIKDSLMTSEGLKHNEIAKAMRSSMIDPKQVCQCLGPRGYVTEIDSTIFPTPITVGYAKGMRSLYESMIESRSASKSLMFQKDPLAKCEYFNRKLQLVAQSVRFLAQGDCGSQHYMPWTVESGEIDQMVGIHYEKDGQLATIKKGDRHLVGQVINLRTPFGCVHPDRQTVCEKCFGETAYSIPWNTIPGQVAAISIGEKVSQLVLSTKHVDGSSKVDSIDLGEFYSQYLVSGAEDNTLRLSRDLEGLPIRIAISSADASDLPSIRDITDFEDINPARISSMRDVQFIIGNKEGEIHEQIVPTSMGSRHGSLTPKALRYIKERGYELDSKGDYVIDLSGWDVGDALFELPLKHVNMLEFQAEIETMILSGGGKKGKNASGVRNLMSFNGEDPADAIKELLHLINSRLSLNLSHVMVMAYSMAAVDPDNKDYRLPRGGEDFKFDRISEITLGRSLGGFMAYQEQSKAFIAPESYIIKDRPSHPMDDLLTG
tara:strand:- start:10157 stop:12112 length:1956 start_codon:yes stop_codon:yes gene_type:complete